MNNYRIVVDAGLEEHVSTKNRNGHGSNKYIYFFVFSLYNK